MFKPLRWEPISRTLYYSGSHRDWGRGALTTNAQSRCCGWPARGTDRCEPESTDPSQEPRDGPSAIAGWSHRTVGLRAIRFLLDCGFLRTTDPGSSRNVSQGKWQTKSLHILCSVKIHRVWFHMYRVYGSHCTCTSWIGIDRGDDISVKSIKTVEIEKKKNILMYGS